MMLTYEERSSLAIQAFNAAMGQSVILPPDIFQKLMMLAIQAEARNSGGVNVYIPFENSYD